MGKEKENTIENKLIDDLISLGYQYLPDLKNEEQLIKNFKKQICVFNQSVLNDKELTDDEFERFYNDTVVRLKREAYPVFAAATILRQPVVFKRDDGTILVI